MATEAVYRRAGARTGWRAPGARWDTALGVAIVELKQGDTEPLGVTLQDELGPVDLDGATALFRMRQITLVPVTPIEAAAVVEQTTDVVTGLIVGKGMVRYDWAAGQTDVVGSYRVEFRVTWAGTPAVIRTFPSGGYDLLVIAPSA